MVAKEISVNVKTKIPSNMITSQASYHVRKMHNLQTIETPKRPKNS